MFLTLKTLLALGEPLIVREADFTARDLLPPGDDTTPLYRECLDAR